MTAEEKAAQRQAKKDARKIKSAAKYVGQVKKYLDSNSVKSAARALNNAKNQFSKISEASLEQEEVIAIKADIDSLTERLKTAESEQQASQNMMLGMVNERAMFANYSNKNPMIFLLASGMVGETEDYDLSRLRDFKKDFSSLDTKEAEFKQQFPLMIKHQLNTPASAISPFTPAIVLDLYKNKEAYRDTYVLNVADNYLNSALDQLKREYENLQTSGTTSSSVVRSVYGALADEPYDAVDNAAIYYEWVGKTVPQNFLDSLASYKPKMRELLESVSQKNTWDASAYPDTDDNYNKLAASACESNETTLVKVGVSRGPWYIHKNDFDIPTARESSGYILCQHPDEPFKRGYKIAFQGQYNGVGYEPVSVYYITSGIAPHK